MKDYILELKRLGYHDEIKKFSSNIKLIAIDKLIENSFCSAFMKEAMQKLIHKRFEEMKNEI